MAEIDAEELGRVAGANIDRGSLRDALRYARRATEDEERTEHHWTPEGENFMSRILLALYSELASLRAPKDELAEAKAELGAWLVAHHGYAFRATECAAGWLAMLVSTRSRRPDFSGLKPDLADAIWEALSRARGEAT